METRSDECQRNYTKAYDASRRTFTVTSPEGRVSRYTVDLAGRISTVNAPGQVPTEFVYNTEGYLLEVRRTKGTDTRSTRYGYESLGRLLRAEVPGKVIHYAHDGRGRRIGRIVSIGGGPATLDKAWIYGDALNPIAQLDSSGTMEAVYLYGTRANVPDAIVTATGTYRVVSDHLGSVRMVVDQVGSVVEEWDYDAYGNVVSSSGSTGLHPFGFAGGITDADTGLVRYGAREYEPGTGKWTSRDPIKFDGGTTNLYDYVQNDPINSSDPRGTQSEASNDVLLWLCKKLGFCGLNCIRQRFGKGLGTPG